MNKKGFTLIELLAVLVIMSIVFTAIISSDVLKIQDNSKKRLYAVDAKNFASVAIVMYNNSKINSEVNYFTKSGNIYTITLDKIENIDISKDPYGYEYDKEQSYISITEPDDPNSFKNREVTVFIKSCNKDTLKKCHCIRANYNEIDESKVDDKCGS